METVTAELDIRILKSRLRLSVFEPVEWSWCIKDVLVAKLTASVCVLLVPANGAAGIDVVVLHWGDFNIVWEGDGQLATWSLVTEEDIS